MIQRVQTIWLILAALCISCLLLLPIVSSNLIGGEFYITGTGLYQNTGNVSKQVESYLPLAISAIALSIFCVINIFNYKNRELQKKLIYVTIILIIGLSFWSSQYAKSIPGGLEIAHHGTGMYLSPLAIAFCLLAVRGITRDQKLLKSADRLR
ncbi:MAG: DUF4293 family protein [Pedobacter sp.]|nr:MAG: DUF4293 family protein [Pedobacter sp.]